MNRLVSVFSVSKKSGRSFARSFWAVSTSRGPIPASAAAGPFGRRETATHFISEKQYNTPAICQENVDFFGSCRDTCWFVCPRSAPGVMAVPGLDPGIGAAIHENTAISGFNRLKIKDYPCWLPDGEACGVDGRHKAGHDGGCGLINRYCHNAKFFLGRSLLGAARRREPPQRSIQRKSRNARTEAPRLSTTSMGRMRPRSPPRL